MLCQAVYQISSQTTIGAFIWSAYYDTLWAAKYQPCLILVVYGIVASVNFYIIYPAY